MTYSSVETLPLLMKVATVITASAGAATGAMLPDVGVLLAYMGLGLAGGAVAPLWNRQHRGFKGFLRAIFSSGIVGAAVGSAVAELTGQPYVAVLSVMVASLWMPDLVTDPFGSIQKILDLVRRK